MKLLLSILILTSYTLFAQAQAVLVHDLQPGTAYSNPGLKHVFNNKLIFWSHIGTGNYELHSYTYNDTTVKLEYDYANGSSGSYWTNNQMVEVNGKMYFGAAYDTLGYELRMWDGINPPVLVKDIAPGSENSMPVNFVNLNNRIYFIAKNVLRGDELWMHDPATNITEQLSNTDPGNVITKPPNDVVVYNGKVYFIANSSLYLYDPAQDTVYKAKNFDIISGGSDPMMLAACYGNLYYFATSIDYGYEMYTYDGNNPPKRVTDINPGKGSSWSGGGGLPYTLGYIVGYKGFVYFAAKDGSSNTNELYKYYPNKDIGTGNPEMVYDIRASSTDLFEFDNKLYFTGSDNLHGYELWVYDGVNKPTMVADINPGIESGAPRYFATYKNELYFTADSKATGLELYKLGNGVHIENISQVNMVKVYPVPTTNILNFEIDLKTVSDFTITLSDIMGREVYNSGEQSYSRSKTVVQGNISQLSVGNYFYRIVGSDGITFASGKVVKE